MIIIPRRHTNSKGIGFSDEIAGNRRLKFLMREIRDMQKKQQEEKMKTDTKISKPNRPSKKKGKKRK